MINGSQCPWIDLFSNICSEYDKLYMMLNIKFFCLCLYRMLIKIGCAPLKFHITSIASWSGLALPIATMCHNNVLTYCHMWKTNMQGNLVSYAQVCNSLQY